MATQLGLYYYFSLLGCFQSRIGLRLNVVKFYAVLVKQGYAIP